MNKPTEEQKDKVNKPEEAKAPAVAKPATAPVQKSESTDAKKAGTSYNARQARPAQKKPGFRGRGGAPKPFPGKDGGQDQAPEAIEKVISINRITKVTKGGKKLSFSALVVVGDGAGKVGYSLSKAREVASAIRKAMSVAKKNMIAVPMRGTTITHEIIGQCGGARVLLKPASDGTGVIASGPVRAVCDGAGIHNILTKCHRSNNPINVVKATINGLERLKPYIKRESIQEEK